MSDNDYSMERGQALDALKSIGERFAVDLVGAIDRNKSNRDNMVTLRRLIVDGVNREFGPRGENARLLEESDVDLEANWMCSQKNADYLRKCTGDAVKTSVTKIRNDMQRMSSATTDAEFVAATMAGAVIGIGVKFGVQLIKGLIIGFPLRTALSAAVSTLGVAFCVATVLVAMVSLLLYFAFLTDRNMMGLVINDTDNTYQVPDWRTSVDGYDKGNLYMAHGEMQAFPYDTFNGDFDSVEIQLKARSYGEPPPTNLNTIVWSALFYAEKKAGFLGAEGVIVFTPYESSTKAFAYQFAVPYARDNRANIDSHAAGTIKSKSDMQSLFQSLYESAGVDITRTVGSYTYTSHLQGSSGSAVCGIASISDRPVSQEIEQTDFVSNEALG